VPRGGLRDERISTRFIFCCETGGRWCNDTLAIAPKCPFRVDILIVSSTAHKIRNANYDWLIRSASVFLSLHYIARKKKWKTRRKEKTRERERKGEKESERGGKRKAEREEREKGKAEMEDWTADAIDRISHVPLGTFMIYSYTFILFIG